MEIGSSHEGFLAKGKLQWGHVQNDVEIWETLGDENYTEGLQWGHVQNDVEIGPDLAEKKQGDGSLKGARCKMTWKYRKTVTEELNQLELQWGHVQNDVEM